MPSVTIAGGTLDYRTLGPADSERPPVVFVHGFLVDSTLWDPVAAQLADHGVRSVLVDWPLGSHRTPMNAEADLSPIGVARMINEVLDALGLTDVTLVGNDTGGALCQLLLADDASRIGRLVLTNCDAFENFPPKAFVPLFHIAKHPALTKAMLAPTRLRAIRHSPLAYGLLLRAPRDARCGSVRITRSGPDAKTPGPQVMGVMGVFHFYHITRETVSRNVACQISTWLPTSNTCSAGSLKNRLALAAPRFSKTNNSSRRGCMPGALPAVTDSRPRKYDTLETSMPSRSNAASALGMSGSSMKP